MLDPRQRDRLGVRYRLHIETICPLNVGSGGQLLQRHTPDFMPVDGQLIVIDPDKLSDVLGTDQIARLMAGAPLAELLEELGDHQKRALAAYTLDDPGGQVTSIRPNIKLLGARPYLPGSSLKGALRTVPAWAMLADGVVHLRPGDLGNKRLWADERLNRAIFGADPNHDVFRALHIRDSEGTGLQGHLQLTQVAVYSIDAKSRLIPKGPGYRFHLETIPEGVKFTASARRDNFILEPHQARRLHFDETGLGYLLRLPYHANRLAERLVQQECDFYRRYGPQPLVVFYERLADMLKGISWDRSCLVQVAWGTGWKGKTVGPALDEALMTEIRARYHLGRPGMVFPKTRRLVERKGEAVMPLGWLQVTFEPLGEENLPTEAPRLEPTLDSNKRPKIEDLEIGKVIEGKVTGIAPFGAFVDIGLPFNGLIHKSQLRKDWSGSVEAVVKIGEAVRVKVIAVDVARRRIGLSLKQV